LLEIMWRRRTPAGGAWVQCTLPPPAGAG